MLQDRPVLVTGAAGFVGANLVARLVAEGARVHAVIRGTSDPWRISELIPQLTIHTVDLTDHDAVHEAVDRVRPDVVFHLAKHRGDPAALDYQAAYDANLTATLHLLEATRRLSLTRFVHAGSSLECDLTRSPLREDDAHVPATVHGVTKAAATLLCRHFARQHRVPAVVLRFFTVYGPWESPARFVPRLMLAALDGRSLPVTRAGLAHDWIFVDDVVEACIRSVAAEGLTGEVINVATGRQRTNEELVAMVEELCGRPIPLAPDPFPSRVWDRETWVADVTRARERLGWQAATQLRAGLQRTLTWFRDHLSAYRERLV